MAIYGTKATPPAYKSINEGFFGDKRGLYLPLMESNNVNVRDDIFQEEL